MQFTEPHPQERERRVMDPTSHKNLHHLLHQITQSPYGGTIHFNSISFLLLFLFLFLFLLSLKLLSTKINLPPSPPRLPIIGNLHQLGSLPHRSLASLSEKYGPLMLLKLGLAPTLVVSSAKLAREVMKSHDTSFSNRSQKTAAKYLFYGCQDVAYASNGEYWRQARKLCVLELLSAKRVEFFQRIRNEEVAKLVKRVARDYSSCVINLNPVLISTSNNITGRCVLGDTFEGEKGFGEVTRSVMVLLSAFCVGDAFPWLGWVDVFRGFHGQLKRTFQTLDGLFEKVIEEHREKMKSSGDDNESCEKNFVGIMLKLQQQEALDYRFTMEDFKAILLDMFVGGTDTTATCLLWTMAELMRNPIAMNKVQEEVRSIVGKKAKIETKDIQRMEYMKCVIKESLRLHPPGPFLLPRETVGITVNLEGYQIPPKTSVWINVWAIQRDPKIWETPNEFIPERFMQEKKSVDFKGHDFEFIPFGSGRRKCIGMSFGLSSFEYVLANLLYWFDWKLPPGELLDMTEQHGLAVFKKLPLNLIPTPYRV